MSFIKRVSEWAPALEEGEEEEEKDLNNSNNKDAQGDGRAKRGVKKTSSNISGMVHRDSEDDSSLTDDSMARGDSYEQLCASDSQYSLKESIRKYREVAGVGSPEAEARRAELKKQSQKVRREKRKMERDKVKRGDSGWEESPLLKSASMASGLTVPPGELLAEAERQASNVSDVDKTAVVDVKSLSLPPPRVVWALGEDGVLETVVTSYTHLVEAVFDYREAVLKSAPPEAVDIKFAFRGLSNKWFGLSSSLSRLEKAVSATAARAIEARLMADFCRSTSKLKQVEEIPRVCLDNVWALLPFMHQHGCATRLTEWSTNVNAAAYFAVEDDVYAEQDGAVWCAATNLLQASNSTTLSKKLAAQAIDLPTYDELLRTISQLRPSNNNEPDTDIERVLSQIKALDEIGAQRLTMAFFEPPLFTPSMVNQSSCYCAMSDPMVKLNAAPEVIKSYMRRIVIPRAIKNEVYCSLELAGVSARSLAPGITSVSKALTKKYHIRTEPSIITTASSKAIIPMTAAPPPVTVVPETFRRHSKIIPDAAPATATTETDTAKLSAESRPDTAPTTTSSAVAAPVTSLTVDTTASDSKVANAWNNGRPKTPGDSPKKGNAGKYKSKSKVRPQEDNCIIA